MHFRVRKNVVQLIRNTYDPTTKKAVATVVTRMPLGEPALTPEIATLLTPEEINETKAWIETQHRVLALRSELAALELVENIALAAQWFERDPDAVAAASTAGHILREWQRLRTTLKRKGLID